MSKSRLRRVSMGLSLTTLLVGFSPLVQSCHAEGECGHCVIDYSKLNLTSEQANKIQQCDQEWFQEYQQTLPEIQDLQRKFKKLMASQRPDEAEIMLVQHQLDSKKAKLKMKATQILLKKQKILDEDQNKELKNQIQNEIQKKSQQNTGINTNIQPVRW